VTVAPALLRQERLPKITLRRYEERDHAAVRQLFVDVNREVATPELCTAFEQYTARSLREEIDRIPQYYGERGGSFWVVELGDGTLVGMFGLESAGGGAAELRRMYVAAHLRRRGVARAMLEQAEQVCCREGWDRIVLSTSELQQPALALYRAAGYRLIREEIATAQTNKTVGGRLRRYHFEKRLSC
jgi:GNAT superfamily N-acetyltransferase